MATKLVIAGCCGRMGLRLADLALDDGVFALSGALESRGHARVGQPLGPLIGRAEAGVRVSENAEETFGAADVIIDFTTPASTITHVHAARSLKKPMVIGTTGLSEAQRGEVAAAAAEIPIVFSPNMSVGVNVLFELVQAAVRRLGPSYDLEVIEAHHREKKDAPSGTAKRLVELLTAVREESGARTGAGPIQAHAVRAGNIVGDHTVIFAGASERLELTHRAQSRDVFAEGALKAARWVQRQPPGLYDMSHVLNATS